MITSFKIFENKSSDDCQTLLRNVMYLIPDDYLFDGRYNSFTITKNHKYIVEIVIRNIIENKYYLAFKKSSDKNTVDDLADDLIDYLKTIKGLKFYDGYYDGTFEIVGDIYDIKKQLNKEDFLLSRNANKYNL